MTDEMVEACEKWLLDNPPNSIWRDRIEALTAENERLREALRWYEAQVNDCRKVTREGNDARYALDKDGGEKARAALEGKQ